MSGTVGRAVSLRASCHGSFSPPSRCSDSAAARVVPPDDLLLPGSSVHLVHTAQTIKQLEYLSAAVLSSRAILLEGETASRKTALVKELARLTNNRLVVIPMTQDTEVAQLIGQWLPLSLQFGEDIGDSTQMLLCLSQAALTLYFSDAVSLDSSRLIDPASPIFSRCG